MITLGLKNGIVFRIDTLNDGCLASAELRDYDIQEITETTKSDDTGYYELREL